MDKTIQKTKHGIVNFNTNRMKLHGKILNSI